MKYLLCLALLGFAVPQKSKVIVRVNDAEGGEAKARIELYENYRRISRKTVRGSHTYFLPKGNYRVLAITCDTVEQKFAVWKDEQEIWLTVREECE